MNISRRPVPTRDLSKCQKQIKKDQPLPSLSEVVNNVYEDAPEGLAQLYQVFQRLGGLLRRHWSYQDYEDRLHDTFLVVAQAIRDGKLREPEALAGYILSVARLTACSTNHRRVRRERLQGSVRYWITWRQGSDTPEEELEEKERLAIMRSLLESLNDKERQILTRFYLHEQTKEQICRDMDLTDTQFRLAKSRAKQRLSRMGSRYRPREEQTELAA